MNRSTNFNFYLPENTDPIAIDDINYNFQQIDGNLKVANNLTTTAPGSVLDARQGKALNDKIIMHVLGSFNAQSSFDSAIISAISNATTEAPYWISITHAFTAAPFDYAVYEGFILKGAGTSSRAGIILTTGLDFITGHYDGTSIAWKGDAKRANYMSQTITVTTTIGGGVALSNFSSFNSSTDLPVNAIVTDSDASKWASFTTATDGKPNWLKIFGMSGVIASQSITVTLFWIRYV